MIDIEATVNTSTGVLGAEHQKGIVGVIIPPPEIRAVVDKTALFVGRNGKSFEQRILNSAEGQTAKFNFMKPFDPYHAYYEAKIKEVEDEKAGIKPSPAAVAAIDVQDESQQETKAQAPQEKPKDKKTAGATVVSASVKASLVNPIAMLAKERAIDSAPAPLEFLQSSMCPNGISACDVDVIKLTAQYTAVNGRDFLAKLAQKEQRNPQFDFLKPTHMLFSYFTSLVDAYSRIIRPSEDLRSRVQQRMLWQQAMKLSVQRWRWTKDSEEQKRMESSEADAERVAFSAIDWMDFVVVETIDFPEDEVLQFASNGNVESTESPTAGDGVGEMKGISSDADDVQMDADDLSDLKVVTDYTFKTSANGSGVASAGGLVQDPITGKPIAASELSEHMRIQLLDPKWRQQQQRFADKQRETGYAEGGSIADSLQMFARKRGDIFGQAVSGAGSNSAAAIAQQEAVERQKQLEQSQVQWDGHHGSIMSAQHAKADLSSQQALAPPLPPSAPSAVSGIAGIGPSFASSNSSLPSFAYNPSSLLRPPPPPSPLSTDNYGGSSFGAPALPPPLPLAPFIQLQQSQAQPLGFNSTLRSAPPPPAQELASHTNGAQNTSFDTVNTRAESAEEPATKRAKASEPALLSAGEFAAIVGDRFQLTVQLPIDSSVPAWNLQGQELTMAESDLVEVTGGEAPAVTTSVKQLKEALSKMLGSMPPSKMQLKSSLPTQGFLKDSQTLDVLNIGDGSVTLELSIKSRGGRK